MSGQTEDRFGVFVSMVVISYLAALPASALTISVWTWQLELVGLGLVIPFFAVPAIVGFALVSVFKKSTLVCTIVYWLLGLPCPLFALAMALLPRVGLLPYSSDGSEEWALAFSIPLMVAAFLAYDVLLWWHVLRWRKKRAMAEKECC